MVRQDSPTHSISGRYPQGTVRGGHALMFFTHIVIAEPIEIKRRHFLKCAFLLVFSETGMMEKIYGVTVVKIKYHSLP